MFLCVRLSLDPRVGDFEKADITPHYHQYETLRESVISFSDPYRPNFLGSCCDKGENTKTAEYVLRA